MIQKWKILCNLSIHSYFSFLHNQNISKENKLYFLTHFVVEKSCKLFENSAQGTSKVTFLPANIVGISRSTFRFGRTNFIINVQDVHASNIVICHCDQYNFCNVNHKKKKNVYILLIKKRKEIWEAISSTGKSYIGLAQKSATVWKNEYHLSLWKWSFDYIHFESFALTQLTFNTLNCCN